MISFLKKIFHDDEVFIVASGPSLIGFDFSLLDNKKTIAVNHSYMFLKKPNLLCYLDSKFSLAVSKTGRNLGDLEFPILSGNEIWDNLDNITNVNTTIVCPENNTSNNLFTKFGSGETSTALAISAALFAGAKKIYLLGVDLYFRGGNKHFYSQEFIDLGIWKSDPSDITRLERMRKTFEKFSGYKDKIINLSIDSTLRTFKKMRIQDVLK